MRIENFVARVPATVSPFSISDEASGVVGGGQMATARPGALEGTGDLAE
jgi:hypothetical protein